MMISKTDQAIAKFKSGDVRGALRLAKTFRLGLTKEEQSQLTRGHECHSNPNFYRQLGKDPVAEIEEAKRIFAERIIRE